MRLRFSEKILFHISQKHTRGNKDETLTLVVFGKQDQCEEGNPIRSATVVREEDFYHYVNFRILDSIGYPGVLTVILNHTKTCYKLNTQCH